MRQEAKYETGRMGVTATVSNMSAASVLPTFTKKVCYLDWNWMSDRLTITKNGKERDSASVQGVYVHLFLCHSLHLPLSIPPPEPFGGTFFQMITLLWAPSGSSCTYSTHHISHFPANLPHYSSTLNPLFSRMEVNRSRSQWLHSPFDHENTVTLGDTQSESAVESGIEMASIVNVSSLNADTNGSGWSHGDIQGTYFVKCYVSIHISYTENAT